MLQQDNRGTHIPFFDAFRVLPGSSTLVLSSSKSAYAQMTFNLYSVLLLNTSPTDTIGVSLFQVTLQTNAQPIGVQFAADTAIYADLYATLAVPPTLECISCYDFPSLDPDFADVDEAFEREFAKQHKPEQPEQLPESGYDHTEPRRG